MTKQIILASNSPRRQTLLQQLGLDFAVVNTGLDEKKLPDESITDYAKRIAQEKAIAAYKILQNENTGNRLFIGADTCGELDNNLLGKPADESDAIRLLQSLSARSHTIHSAFALFDGRRWHVQNVVSTVTFREITLDEITAYWHTGEPSDKAGAYAIQGLGAQFVSHLSGSYSAVMGLPLFELANALRSFNVKILAS